MFGKRASKSNKLVKKSPREKVLKKNSGVRSDNGVGQKNERGVLVNFMSECNLYMMHSFFQEDQ